MICGGRRRIAPGWIAPMRDGKLVIGRSVTPPVWGWIAPMRDGKIKPRAGGGSPFICWIAPMRDGKMSRIEGGKEVDHRLDCTYEGWKA